MKSSACLLAFAAALAAGWVSSAARAQDAAPASTPARATSGEEGAEGHGAGTAGPAAPADPLADLVHRGHAARQAGRIDEALEHYRQAQALAPGMYDIRILIAETLRRSARLAESASAYEAAQAIDPARSEAYAGRALLRRAAFDHDGAYAIAAAALPEVPPARRPDLLMVMAETRRRQGRLQDAARLFQEVLAIDRDHIPVRAGLAQLAEDRGDLDGALRGWDAYQRARPDDEPVAMRRQELRELRASIEALRAAVAQRPSPGLLAELGRLLAVAGDAAGAASAYRKALSVAPGDAGARRGLALAVRDGGDGRGATREFRRTLKAAPGDPIALYNLVALARQAGDLRGERAAWDALLRTHPDDLFATRAYVDRLERSGDEALERAIAATAPDGRDPGRLRLRALLCGAAGRWKEAGEALYAALRIDPTDPWTQAVGGDLMFLHPDLLGDLGAFLRAEAVAVDETAAGGAALVALAARLAWWAGRPEEALDLAGRAVATDPRSAIARSILAEASQQVARDAVRAIDELQTAVALPEPRPSDRIDLALTLLRSGRPRLAEAAAREALAVAPSSGPALSVLGMALSEQGDFEAAADAYAAALVADPADNFGLARRQYPLMLAALGRNVEARRSLRGDIPPLPEMVHLQAWVFTRDACRDRTFNGQDWKAWRSPAGDLRDIQEAYRSIAAMLASLGDPYTRLRDAEETAMTQLARRGERSLVDRFGRNRPGSRSVVGGELPGGLGYIRLANLDDPLVVARVRDLLTQMRAREGIVLDLRGNTGGFSRAADAISDMLIGPGRTAGTDAGPEGRAPRVTGGQGAITGAPITVLVDGQTASAAERLARDLEITGRATIAGERTRGKGLAQASLVLPGGAMVLVSTSEMLDARNRPIQGRGIAPSVPDAVVPDAPGRTVPD